MEKVCKKHQAKPAIMYGQCIGCELDNLRSAAKIADGQIQYLQQEIDKNISEAETVSDTLQLCVCKLYDAELITASRACELLGVKMQSFQYFYRSDWRDKW